MPSLSALLDAAPRKPRRRMVLRPVRATVAFESELAVLSRSAIREISRISRADLLSAAMHNKALIADADIVSGRPPASLVGQALARLRSTAERVVDAIVGRLVRLFAAEGERFDRRFTASFSAAVADGIDLSRVIRRRGIESETAAAAERHAALIRGLADEVVKRIAARLSDLMIAGAANRAIADMLAEEFGFGLRRARFIARDQAAKWNGELNRLRQGEAGVKEYVWSTSLDERVRGNPQGRYPNARPSHWVREGKTFRWSAPAYPTGKSVGKPRLHQAVVLADV